MDTETRDELRLLRARAYGPAADIQGDPAALQRLHELEALVSRPAPVSPVAAAAPRAAERAPAPEPVAVFDTPSHAEAASALAVDPGPGSSETEGAPPPPRSGIRRRTRVLWVLSVLASAAVAAGITYGLTSVAPVAVSHGARQIATLEPTSIEIPAGWMGAGPSSVTWEFYGLTLFETAHGFNGPGDECFTLVRTDQVPAEDADTGSWSFDGNMYASCGVGVFPATIEMVVDSNAPEELRAQFPDRALQFVMDGDRVGVFLDEN